MSIKEYDAVTLALADLDTLLTKDSLKTVAIGIYEQQQIDALKLANEYIQLPLLKRIFGYRKRMWRFEGLLKTVFVR